MAVLGAGQPGAAPPWSSLPAMGEGAGTWGGVLGHSGTWGEGKGHIDSGAKPPQCRWSHRLVESGTPQLPHHCCGQETEVGGLGWGAGVLRRGEGLGWGARPTLAGGPSGAAPALSRIRCSSWSRRCSISTTQRPETGRLVATPRGGVGTAWCARSGGGRGWLSGYTHAPSDQRSKCGGVGGGAGGGAG